LVVTLPPSELAITQQAADREQALPRVSSRDVEFRMSNERCRREATRAVASFSGGIAFAFPVARVSPDERLLLVLHADDEHLADAIDAVLSADPAAEAVLSRALFADPMDTTLTEHTREIVRFDAEDGYPNTEFRASCETCWWIGPSRSSHEESHRDAELHIQDWSP
jgi:hypothetical protein